MNLSMKLRLGCEPRHIPGFYHVDIADHGHIDHRGPVEDLSFRADESVDLIHASHLLAQSFMSNPGGAVTRIAVAPRQV